MTVPSTLGIPERSDVMMLGKDHDLSSYEIFSPDRYITNELPFVHDSFNRLDSCVVQLAILQSPLSSTWTAELKRYTLYLVEAAY